MNNPKSLIALAVMAFLLLFIVTPLTIHFMKKPSLSPGDRLETRTCRECGGGGKIRGDAYEGDPRLRPGGPCPACKGKGKVQVIIPGPKHPVAVKGVVFDKGAYPQEDAPGAQLMLERDPRKPVPGAIGQAKIAFISQGRKLLEVTSNATGRFKALVPPGTYKVTATAGGFQPYEEAFSVPPLTEPIWLEEARIVREPESMGEELTTFGLELRIRMNR
ncbi:MAG: carboxypeptidase regulatory-like domain-containing protein [Armatimonadetes bacterium]|nr:carboxypeptidase regulatory-like domain-containing protein [Armatimonadota bacterium]